MTKTKEELNVNALSMDRMVFFVVKYDRSLDLYVQCSVRMSLSDATRFCNYKRESNSGEDYKVHAELDL